jgi:tetratricopeptide (TPR) repeat protein
VARGYRNLANVTEDIGEQDELLTAAAEIDRRLGDETRLQYTRAALVQNYSDSGRWDDALRVANEFIAECDSGRPHYSEPWVRLARGLIRLARGEEGRVLAEVDRAIAQAREGKDPQLLFGSLGAAARVYTELGRIDEARAIADEVIAARPEAGARSFDLVFVAHRLGIAQTLLEAFGDVHPEKRLDNGAVAFLDERFEDAAQIFEDVSERESAAYARLRGAEALHAQGRSKEAASIDLEKALSFYRSVGAERFIGETEALLAEIHQFAP